MEAMTPEDAVRVTDPLERAGVLSRLMAEHAGLLAEAAELRRAAVAEARAAGLSVAEIAGRLGVSPARVASMAGGPEPAVLVRRALPTDPAVRASTSLFLAEAERQGLEAGRRMLYVGPEPAAEHVAACLRVEPGAEVIARRKVMTVGGMPVRVATSYFRADLFGGTRLAEPGFVRPSLQSALVALGHSFGRAEETLTARPPVPSERETLELDPGEWVVQVLRAGYSTDDTPVHVLETICAATRHVFTVGQVPGHDEF
ncbi:GntR family transcriptional regulator [Nonomuraea indica]|uniref:GntR family transcriptional regulator n=1 Tax=Nonomuraea indica TaxID=1581193 RepID=UPI000C7DA41E|nr:UTRA domain-containing protein [Nonomuraea indica]